MSTHEKHAVEPAGIGAKPNVLYRTIRSKCYRDLRFIARLVLFNLKYSE